MANGDPVLVSTKPVTLNGIHSSKGNIKKKDIDGVNKDIEGRTQEKLLPPDGGVQVICRLNSYFALYITRGVDLGLVRDQTTR